MFRWTLIIAALAVSCVLWAPRLTAAPPAVQEEGDHPEEEKARDGESEEAEEAEARRAELVSRLEQKLQKDFVGRLPWTRDLSSATEMARNDRKPILAYFTRSAVSCDSCEELEDGPLNGDWFVERSRSFVPLLDVTWTLDEEESCEEGSGPKLTRPQSYPAIVFLDPDGTPLFGLDLRGADPERFHRKVGPATEDATQLVSARGKLLEKKSRKRSRALVAMIESLRGIEHHDPAQLEKAAKVLRKEENLLARYAEYKLVRPVELVQERYKERIADAMTLAKTDRHAMRAAMNEARDDALSEVYELYKAGRDIQSPDHEIYEYFWKTTVEAALARKDKRTAAIAHNALVKICDEKPQLKYTLLSYRRQIEAL